MASGLGIAKLPTAAHSAVPPRTDLAASDALSILKNPPGSFNGRKLGVLVTDGVDAKLLAALRECVNRRRRRPQQRPAGHRLEQDHQDLRR